MWNINTPAKGKSKNLLPACLCLHLGDPSIMEQDLTANTVPIPVKHFTNLKNTLDGIKVYFQFNWS